MESLFQYPLELLFSNYFTTPPLELTSSIFCLTLLFEPRLFLSIPKDLQNFRRPYDRPTFGSPVTYNVDLGLLSDPRLK